jgi:hypothetical protein
MRSPLSLASAIAVAALAMSACGGNDEEAATTSADSAETTETTEAGGETLDVATVVTCLDEAFAPTIDVQSAEVSESDIGGGQVNLLPEEPITEVQGTEAIVFVPGETIVYFLASPADAEAQANAVEKDSGGTDAEVVGNAVAAVSPDATTPEPEKVTACLEA